MTNTGDFRTVPAAKRAAKEYNEDERSATQRAADAAKRAPVTTDYQRWVSDPSGLDFPGVDTPTDSPGVLPKDLKQQERPMLTARASGEAPITPVDRSTEDLERRSLREQDVSLAPQEAFRGVGAVGRNALGGFNSTVERETAPRQPIDERPPDFERGEDPFELEPSGTPLQREAPSDLPGGFALETVDTGGVDGFTELQYRRDSDIPGVEDVIRVQ